MFFVAKICKHTLCASNVGYLAVATSTPTSATLADAVVVAAFAAVVVAAVAVVTLHPPTP